MARNLRSKFNKIYDKYIEKIYRFIFFKVDSQNTAEDLTSEVFTRVWKLLKNGTEMDNANAYLYQIARNLVIDYYRQKDEPLVSLADCKEISDPSSSIQQAAAFQSDIDKVKASLAFISDDYREIITLRYIEDYSVSEIAKILDRPEGTIRVMMHRGLEELREKLNDD